MSARRQGESGNVFFTLFGAVALVGVIGVATATLMRGPVGTMMAINQKAKVDSQLQIARKLVALNAVSTAGDCDADTFVEPSPPDTSSAGCNGLLTGGGCIPSTVGAAKTDPWGTLVGYCGWNHGTVTTGAGCSAGLLQGANATDKTVIALISAGPDRTFQTTCADGPAYVTKGGDDIVDEWTFDEAQSMGGGGLWTLQSGKLTPSGTQDVSISSNATFASGKTADFQGTANFGAGSQLNLANGGLFNLPTQVQMPDGACNGANDGVLRINTSGGPGSRVLEICNGTSFISAGSTVTDLNSLTDAVSDFATGANVFLGNGSGNLITAGSALRNTAVGIDAAQAVTTGKDNVLLGYNAGKDIDTGNGNIFIGSSSTTNAMDGTAAAANTLNIGGTIFGTSLYSGSGSIGINTATPGAMLDVNGTFRAGNGSFTGTLGAAGAVTASSTLDVTGATTLGSTLSVAGNVSAPGGTVNVASNLDTTGTGAFSGTLTVGGATTINNTLHVTGAGTFDSDLDVTGHVSAGNDMSAANYHVGLLTSGIGMFTDGSNGLQLETNAIKRLQITSGGAVGIGVTSPATELDVGGAIKVGNDASSCGAGLYGAIRYSSATDKVEACSNTNAWVTIGTSGGGGGGGGGFWLAGAGSNIYYSLGNVGVGTATPNTALEVAGALRLSGATTDTYTTPAASNVPTKINVPLFDPGNFGQVIAMGVPATAQVSSRVMSIFDARAAAHQPSISIFNPNEADVIGFSWEGDNNNAYVKTLAGNIGFRVNATDIMMLYNSGNVGINASGATRLDVGGTIRVANGGEACAAGTAGGIRYNAGLLEYCDGAAWTGLASAASTTAPGADREIVFNSGGVLGASSSLVFTSAGRLGLGTNNPQYSFDIDETPGAGSVVMNFGNAQQNAQFQIRDRGATRMLFGIEGPGLWIDRTQYRLEWNQDNNNYLDFNNNMTLNTGAHDIVFGAGGVDRLHILNGGNVGINNAAPAVKLDVAGTLRVADSGEACVAGIAGGIRYSSASLQYCDGSNWIAVASAATAAAAGADGQVQFNSGGLFGASANFYWDKANSRLGLGTAVPAQRLEVAGNALIKGLIYGGTDATPDANYLDLSPSGEGDIGALFGFSNGASLKFLNEDVMGTGSDDLFVQLWSANPAAYSYLESFNNAGLVVGSGSGPVIFRPARTEIMRVVAGGVAIGNNSPATILDVTGTIRVADGGEACAAGIAGGIRYSSANLQYCNGTAWTTLVGAGSGALALDDLSDASTDYTGDHNMFVGTGAGAAIASGGTQNLVIGQNGGAAIATGDYNVGLGYEVLKATTGTSNTAIGNQVLTANIGGSYNTGVGTNALMANTTGDRNVAVGRRALFANQGGVDNVAVGQLALSANVNGGSNTALGEETLANNTGSWNTAVGSSALNANVASVYSTAVGGNALKQSTGNHNTGLGFNAGTNITSGTDNIMIGYNALAPVATADNQLNIGNTIYGDLANKYVGINTGALPGEMLFVSGGNLAVTGTVGSGAAISLSGPGTRMFFYPRKAAFRAGHAATAQWDDGVIGNYSVAMGNSTVASGSYSTALGSGASASGNYSVAIGDGVSASNSDGLALGKSVRVSGANSFGWSDGATPFSFPDVSGTGSIGFFMQDQNNKVISANNVMGLIGGRFVIDPNSTATLLAPNANTDLDVNGNIGAINYCDVAGANCFTAAGVSGAIAGATPGGPFKSIQFNSAGGFGGSANLTWDYTTGHLGVGTNAPVDTLSIGTAPVAGATRALVNLSNTALSGGSANGTYIGANPAAFTGDFLNFQINGATKVRVDSTSSGQIYLGGSNGIEMNYQMISQQGSLNNGGAVDWFSFLNNEGGWVDSGAYAQNYIRINPTYNPSAASVSTTISGFAVTPTFNPSASTPTVNGQWISGDIKGTFGSGDEDYNAAGPMVGLRVAPTINVGAGSTGGVTALLVNPTLTSVSGTASNYLADFQAGGSSKMVITTAGDVGIGTANPGFPLEVVGTNGGGDTMKLRGTGVSSSLIFFNAADVWSAGIGVNNSTGEFNIGSGAADLIFLTDNSSSSWGTERVRILQSNGYMGINTVTPAVRLDVDGTLRVADGGEACAAGTAGGIRYNGGNLQYCNGTAWTSLSTASGAAAGANTQIQFNSGGAFGASGNFTWDNAGNILRVTGKERIGVATPAALTFPGLIISQNAGGYMAIGSPTQGDWGGGFIELGRDSGPNGGPTGTWRTLYEVGGETYSVSSSDDSRDYYVKDLVSNQYIFLANANDYVGLYTNNPTAGFDVRVPVTAAGASGVGVRYQQTLTAAADNDALSALYINPTFADAGHSGIAHNGLIVGSGNVGIGKTNPSVLLDVNGQVAFVGNAGGNVATFYSNSGGYRAEMIVSSGAGGSILQTFQAGGDYQPLTMDGVDFRIKSGPWAGVHDEKLRVTSAGDVGIGTTGPATKLDVNGTLRIADGGEACAAGVAGGIRYNGGNLQYCNGTAWASLSTASGAAAGATGQIQFNSGGAFAASANLNWDIANGRLGIGTASPNNILEVQGASADVAYFGSTTAGNHTNVYINAPSGAGNAVIAMQRNGSGVYDIYADAGGLGLYSYSNTSTTAYFTNGGNVGIGKSPAVKLDVNGTLKIANGAETCTIAGDGGMVRYNSSNIEYCNGAAWTPLAATGGSTNLGTAVNAANPQRSGDATTGFYTPGASQVAVTNGGVETMQWNTTASGVNYFTVASGATGNAPTISNAGSDTNGLGLGINIAAKNATAAGQGGGLTLSGGMGNGALAGGGIILQPGQGGATGAGGALNLFGGPGGPTSGAGGATTIRGGNATAGNSAGGAMNVNGGTGQGTAAGGALALAAGNGGATGTGGAASLAAGNSGTGTDKAGGNVTIQGGSTTGAQSTFAIFNMATRSGSGTTANATQEVARLGGGGLSLMGGGAYGALMFNSYVSGTGGSDTYLSNNPAFEIWHDSTASLLKFGAAPSGTAGNPVTFTYGMYMDTNGRIGIRNDAPAALIDIGKASTTQGTLRLQNSANANYVQLQASNSATAAATYTLPTAPPASNGYVLSSTTAGVMSWTQGGVFGSDKQIAFNDNGTESGNANLTFDKTTNTFSTSIVSASSKVALGLISGAAAPTTSNVSLTSDVSGVLPVANGGTGNSGITAMGTCTIASYTPTNTTTNQTCTGIPASTAVAVSCSASAAFTTPNTTVVYARATGTANQVAINLSVANSVAVTFKCTWMQ